MPTNYTLIERRALLRTLGVGRSNVIGAKRLARMLNYSVGGNQVRLRGLIKECIEVDGDLIGAATGRPAGFFRISNIQELETYIDTLESRTRSDNVRRSALLTSWNNSHMNANAASNILTII